MSKIEEIIRDIPEETRELAKKVVDTLNAGGSVDDVPGLNDEQRAVAKMLMDALLKDDGQQYGILVSISAGKVPSAEPDVTMHLTLGGLNKGRVDMRLAAMVKVLHQLGFTLDTDLTSEIVAQTAAPGSNSVH